jgi:hypothetical protein
MPAAPLARSATVFGLYLAAAAVALAATLLSCLAIGRIFPKEPPPA